MSTLFLDDQTGVILKSVLPKDMRQSYFCSLSTDEQTDHLPTCLIVPTRIPITQALTAVGQEFEIREVPYWDRGEILKLTNGSYYQVPVIQFEDRIVYESGTDTLDVARLVDKEFGQDKLFPKEFEGLQQIIVPYIENEVEGNNVN